MWEKIKSFFKIFFVRRVLRYMDRDPEESIPAILKWIERFDKAGSVRRQVQTFRGAIEDKQSNWSRLTRSLWSDIDKGVRRRVFENLVINSTLIGSPKQDKTRAANNCNIPWTVLMDPTSSCNLNCIGCWAAEYKNGLQLSYEQMNDIILQGKEMGIYTFLFSGGEPLVRKKDILRLCEKNSDCLFLAFTNGTLIDEAFAEEMLRVKNFIPAISIEGFEKDTDSRRGAGVYGTVTDAMKILKRHKLLFGISCCYTRENTETVGSEEYFDEMVSMGAKFAWFFTYMPIGAGAPTELMVTAEQREFMYRQIRSFRNTKPIFTLDFWNDGEYIGGCVAGGRYYVHINANGDIEPCAFIHYSDSNIRDKTLLEALKSPLFMEYYKNQPFNDNHLRPCPLLDNPQRLVEMVEQSGAASTDMRAPEKAAELAGKCTEAAESWAVTAEYLWSGQKAAAKDSCSCVNCGGCCCAGYRLNRES